MTKNFFILTILLLLSCGKRLAEPETSERSNKIVFKAEDKEEFNEFFKRFTTDSSFQMERTKFPFRVLWLTDDGETVHETAKGDWTHLTFHYEDSYASRQIDAYTQEAKDYGDTVRLELRGVDNGIFIEYNFTRDKGKWYLVSEKDLSN